MGPLVRRRAGPARRAADRRRRADAQVLQHARSAAPTSLRAMRWRSERRGGWRRRCSSARTSASTRSTCCFRAGCASRSTSLGLALLDRLLRAGRLARLRRRRRNPGPRARAASPLLQTPTVIPQTALDRRACCCSSLVGVCCSWHALGMLGARRPAPASAGLIGTRSAEEEVEDEIRDLKQRQARGQTR